MASRGKAGLHARPLNPPLPATHPPTPCTHLKQQRPTPFADPWLMRLGEEETVGQLRQRVREKLGVPEKDFAAWRTVLCT